MTLQEATDEMNRLIESPELRPHKWIKWVGRFGLSVLPYGTIGILPNPNEPGAELPPDTDYRVIYQDHDAGRTVTITGWSGAQVLQLLKERAEADGMPFPPAAS